VVPVVVAVAVAGSVVALVAADPVGDLVVVVSVVLAAVLVAAAGVLVAPGAVRPRALSGAVAGVPCVGASPSGPNAKSSSRCRLRPSAG